MSLFFMLMEGKCCPFMLEYPPGFCERFDSIDGRFAIHCCLLARPEFQMHFGQNWNMLVTSVCLSGRKYGKVGQGERIVHINVPYLGGHGLLVAYKLAIQLACSFFSDFCTF